MLYSSHGDKGAGNLISQRIQMKISSFYMKIIHIITFDKSSGQNDITTTIFRWKTDKILFSITVFILCNLLTYLKLIPLYGALMLVLLYCT